MYTKASKKKEQEITYEKQAFFEKPNQSST